MTTKGQQRNEELDVAVSERKSGGMDGRVWLLLLAVVVIVLDRVSKMWVTAHVPRGTFLTVIPNVFRISHVFNTGAAFSLFAESLSPRWSAMC